MKSSFPDRWSFSYLKFTNIATNIIGEPNYKYGQQEQVTVRNHNQKYRLGTVGIKISWGSLNRFYGIPTSPSCSVVLHYKSNITHIIHNNKEYEVCMYYNLPLIKFVTQRNKMTHNINTALERSVLNHRGGGGAWTGFTGYQPRPSIELETNS